MQNNLSKYLLLVALCFKVGYLTGKNKGEQDEAPFEYPSLFEDMDDELFSLYTGFDDHSGHNSVFDHFGDGTNNFVENCAPIEPVQNTILPAMEIVPNTRPPVQNQNVLSNLNSVHEPRMQNTRNTVPRSQYAIPINPQSFYAQQYYQHLYQQQQYYQNCQNYHNYMRQLHFAYPKYANNTLPVNNTVQHQEQKGTKRSRVPKESSNLVNSQSRRKKRRIGSDINSEPSPPPSPVVNVELIHIFPSSIRSSFFDKIQFPGGPKTDGVMINSFFEDASTRNFIHQNADLQSILDVTSYSDTLPPLRIDLSPKGMIFGDVLNLPNVKSPNFLKWSIKKLEEHPENAGIDPWIRENGLLFFINNFGCIIVYNAGDSPVIPLVIPIGSGGRRGDYRVKTVALNSEPVVLHPLTNGDLLLVLPKILLTHISRLSFNVNSTIKEIQNILVEGFLLAGLRPFFVLSEINIP